MIRRRFGTREEVVEPVITSQYRPVSPLDLSTVAEDWKALRRGFRNVGTDIFLHFTADYPEHRKNLGKFLDPDTMGDLKSSRFVRNHGIALENFIGMALSALSGEYEDDDSLLTVGDAHRKRGIGHKMFSDLRDSVVSVCCDLLQSNRAGKLAWAKIMGFIFDRYFGRMPTDEEATEK